MNLLKKNRPTAASNFISKYCELSSSYYASCAKGFFEDLRQNSKHILKKNKLNRPALIGDPIEGDDLKVRRRSSFTSFFISAKARNNGTSSDLVQNGSVPSSPINSNEDSNGIINEFCDIPYNAASLLIELLRRESTFSKNSLDHLM